MTWSNPVYNPNVIEKLEFAQYEFEKMIFSIKIWLKPGNIRAYVNPKSLDFALQGRICGVMVSFKSLDFSFTLGLKPGFLHVIKASVDVKSNSPKNAQLFF